MIAAKEKAIGNIKTGKTDENNKNNMNKKKDKCLEINLI